MNFFNNAKYRDNEKKIFGGDTMRSEISKKFPWSIKKITFQDNDNDTWNIECICDEISQEEKSQKLVAKITYKCTCEISESHIKKMGFYYERLKIIEDPKINMIEFLEKSKLSITMENLNQKVEEYGKLLISEIKEKCGFEWKKQTLTKKCREIKLSHFI